MISKPFLIDCLIDGFFFSKALVDTGCLCYSVFDENLVRINNLQTVSVTPRKLTLADGKAFVDIEKMAKVEMDINGRKENLSGYVMPNLAYPIILGKSWMEYNNVVYTAKLECLRIGSRKHRLLIRGSGWYEKNAPTGVHKRVSQLSIGGISTLSPEEFAKVLQKEGRSEGMNICSISVKDITRAIEPNISHSYEEIEKALPEEIRGYTKLFMDDDENLDECLPPHRPGIDTHVTLKRDDRGQEKEVPWGPLYGMSRHELLVLRETLADLQKKNGLHPAAHQEGSQFCLLKKQVEASDFA